MKLFNVFKDKSVLITGHTGFKGSWLSLWLTTLGANVHGFSLLPNTQPNHYTIANIAELLDSQCIGDIKNYNTLQTYIHEIQPDCIFHLAAQPLVKKSYVEPIETFNTNVMGSIYLMDAIRTLNKPCSIIMITSDKCYENSNKKEYYTENDPMGGYDPYSASKGCAELAISSYRRSFFPPIDINKHGISVASVRAGNVIGGGDWADDRIIPDAVRAVIMDEYLEIRNPNAIRPWQHVLEPLSGYMLLAAKMMHTKSYIYSDGWNFGPKENESPMTVSNIISDFYNIWGKGEMKCDITKNHPHETDVLMLSSRKAEKLLDWKHQWNINETIIKTADWYKKFYAGYDARELSLSDIKHYTSNMRY